MAERKPKLVPQKRVRPAVRGIEVFKREKSNNWQLKVFRWGNTPRKQTLKRRKGTG